MNKLREKIARIIVESDATGFNPRWEECPNPDWYLGIADRILNLIPQYEPAQLEVLSPEEIGNCLDLEIEKEYPRSDGSSVWTVNCDKVSQATIAHNEAKGQLFRVKGEDEKW